MGHSFTSFKNHNIRSKDYKIETWFLLIVREIDSFESPPTWLVEAREYWYGQGMYGVNGCVDPRLDEFLIESERLTRFRSLCQTVHDNLLKHGATISKEYLNELHGLKSPNDIREDNETELYLKYGRALLRLLDGRQTMECESA